MALDAVGSANSVQRRRLPTRASVLAAPRRAFAHFTQDPYRLALMLYLVVVISRIHQHYPVIARFRPAFLLFVVAAGYAAIRPGILAGLGSLRVWPVKALFALGIAVCLSVPFGISLGGSASFVLGTYLKLYIFTFMLILAFRDAPDIRLFVWAYVASLGFLVWMALFVFAPTVDYDGTVRLNELYSYDSNDLGTVLVMGLPLALLTFQTSGLRGRIFSGLIVLGIGAALAKTGSRGAFVGFLSVGLGLFFVVRTIPLSKRIAFVAVVVVAMVAAAPSGYWERISSLRDPTQDYNWDTEDGRRQLALRGLGYMMQYPLFGIGIHNFFRAEGTISSKARTRVAGEGIVFRAAHNSHVQVAAELGITGLVIWTVLMVAGVVVPLRLRRRMPSAWARGSPDEKFLYFGATYLPVSYVGFIVAGTFVSFAYYEVTYLLIALLIGLQACVERRLGRATSAARTPLHASPRRRRA